jgi:hypothetical protein
MSRHRRSQPKIRDDLIRRLFHRAQARKVPMTQVVHEMVEQGIASGEQDAAAVHAPPVGCATQQMPQKR